MIAVANSCQSWKAHTIHFLSAILIPTSDADGWCAVQVMGHTWLGIKLPMSYTVTAIVPQ